MFISFQTQLGDQTLGQERATCPHCGLEVDLEVRQLSGTIWGVVPLAPGRALTCLSCGGVSRREGRANRIFSALFLVPFGLALGGGIGAGLWMAISSMMEGLFDLGFLAIAAVLIAGAGYLEYRVIRSIRALLGDRQLQALDGRFHTRL